MLELRKNQIEPVKIGIEHFKKDAPRNSLMVEPVAFGKSIVIAHIAKGISGKTVVLQPSLELLEQNYSKFTKLGGKASIYSASAGEKEFGKITYATIGSIVSVATEFARLGYTNLIVDEADRYPRRVDSMFGDFMKKSNIKKVLGFTATPFKLQTNSAGNWENYSVQKMLTSKGGKKGTVNFFKDIIHITQIQDIINDGFWAPLEYEVYDFNSEQLVYNSTKAEFTDESVTQVYEDENIRQKIVDKLQQAQFNRKSTLVFVPSVAEALILEQLIPESVAVWGDMPAAKRREAIRAFRAGEKRVAINVNVLSVGFDYEEIDCIILGRPTASLSLYYQQCGRGTRIHPAKKSCLIVDFSGNVKKFGKIEDFVFKKDVKWKLYGTGGSLLTDIPIHEIGQHTEEGEKQKLIEKEKQKLALAQDRVKVTFGKFAGKMVDETPSWWRRWVMENFDFNEKTMPIKNEILRLQKY